jgi:hypothetical protein
MLDIKGTLVLSIVVGSDGEVICVEYVSGHPLLLGVAIDSLRRWSLRPYAVKGRKRKFCGRIGLRYEANEGAVKYEVISSSFVKSGLRGALISKPVYNIRESERHYTWLESCYQIDL